MADRPDLLAGRIVNRVRAFFGFQTLAGAITTARSGPVVGTGVMGPDALLWAATFLGPAAVFLLPSPTGGADAARLLTRLVSLFAIPFWLFFAHGNQHLAVTPLLAVLAGVAFCRRALAAADPAGRRCRWMLGGLIVLSFLAIQVEWAYWNMRGRGATA